MSAKEKFWQIYRITMAWVDGGISRGEHAVLLNEILTRDPELPLGIGAVMPEIREHAKPTA